MNRVEIRSILIKIMLGCLILAATIAVIAVLIGDFTETASRSLITVLSALMHIAIVFGLVSTVVSKDDSNKKSADVVVNLSLIIAVLSFFTSVFGIWGLMEAQSTGKLYITYVVALFVLLHGKSLYDAQIMHARVKPYVFANYILIALVAGLILGLVYLDNRALLITEFYGRLLAASAIIDVTLSVIVAVMLRLYMQQHPELETKLFPERRSSGKILIILLLFFFIVLPLMRLVLGIF